MIKISAIGKRVVARTHRIPRIAGFTLIELMVTLVIMVLLAASMPFALNRLVPGYRFRAATEQLVIELQRGRSQAQARGQIVVIACKKSASPADASARTADKIIVAPGHAELRCTALPSGQEVDHLTLYPDGSATGGRIAVTDGKRIASLELSALTGRVRVIG